MRYLSVCSGIEAASVAWHPLGWQAVAYAEIEAFPSAVLAHHYPTVPNWGDMTKFKEWPDATFDLLVGGTPCQSFSVAGLRKGLADPRGNLALTYLAIADKYRPEWLVWENVPGVLSSGDGRDFGAFLGGLVELGYGWAYRVLDAQYFGVAQRRRRVFVVASARGWQRAAAVLFDSASLRGDSPPRREAGEVPARSIEAGAGRRRGSGIEPSALTPEVANTLGGASQSGGFRTTDLDNQVAFIPEIVPQAMSSKWSKGSSGPAGDEVANLIAHSLRADGFDASVDGTGRGTPLVPISIQGAGQRSLGPRMTGCGVSSEGVMYTLQASEQHAVAFAQNQREEAGALPAIRRGDAKNETLIGGMAVRRLTPTECERLQGFPDGYTAVPYRGKPAADGPRYKALGNSMAVPVMAWIGCRIQMLATCIAR